MEVYRILVKTLGKDALSESTVCERRKRFKNEDWSVEEMIRYWTRSTRTYCRH